MSTILSDEPTLTDKLDRGVFVDALSSVIAECQTPFVLGVFGNWGTGKTSLLKMVRNGLPKKDYLTIWFDAWLHQDDENPSVALLQTLVAESKLGDAGKKMLTVISAGLTNLGTKLITAGAVTSDDIKKFGDAYEEEKFQQRDVRIRLREHYEEIVTKARGEDRRRLVFFIDDLDRCNATTQIKILEALKLFLNIDGCVYVLAADRVAIQRALTCKYGDGDRSHIEYLDKIVQLPFHVPLSGSEKISEFISSQLPSNISSCLSLLNAGLSANPRSIKRFINILRLFDKLARRRRIKEFDVKILCTILLIQYHDIDRYMVIALAPDTFHEIVQPSSPEKNPYLAGVFQLLTALPKNIADYIYLTDSAGAEISDPLDGSIDVAENTAVVESRSKRSTRRPSALFMRPVVPSQELSIIVGDKPLPRTELTKKLWHYIKINGLQDRKIQTKINADENLMKIFGGKKTVSMFEMTKFVSEHTREM